VITSQAEAEARRFVGSPTILIDGVGDFLSPILAAIALALVGFLIGDHRRALARDARVR
jgi:hypothetical protein